MESLGVKRDAETGVFSNEYDLGTVNMFTSQTQC